jgi:hypothetical protein
MMRIVTTVLLFFLSGCIVSNVEQARVAEPAPLAAAVPSRPLRLDRVVFDVRRGAVIGTLMRGFCLGSDPLKWSTDSLVLRKGDYHLEFEKVIQKYNFRLPPKPASMFETSVPTGDELVIAAKISDIKENRCEAIHTWSGKEIYKGSVRFAVHWEVYSLADLKVVFTLDNVGFAALEEWKPYSNRYYEDYYYPTAFGNALRGLLENPEFRNLAVTPARKAPALGTGT